MGCGASFEKADTSGAAALSASAGASTGAEEKKISASGPDGKHIDDTMQPTPLAQAPAAAASPDGDPEAPTGAVWTTARGTKVQACI